MSARAELSLLKWMYLDAEYEGMGKHWAEEALNLSMKIVRKPKGRYLRRGSEDQSRRVGQGGREG
jgi:hypothetical protein